MKRPIAWIALCSLFACGGADSGDVGPAEDSVEVVPDEAPAAGQPEPGVGEARADMVDAEGRGLGAVILNENGGEVALAGALIALSPGEHGFHIHETGACDPPDFESAGSHVAPAGNPHGFQAVGGPHAGDLWNLVAGRDSIATVELETSLVSLRGGDAPLLDHDGSALVVHADPDDYVSQPAGNSGARIACGVIEE